MWGCLVMKEVFIPSMDDLYKMQDMHINILPYLYAKAIERLCIEYNNYPKMGSILRNEYKYLREDPVIAKAICIMYPKEIVYSDVVKYDVDLAMKVIGNSNGNDIYRLDNLANFDNSLDSNLLIQREVIRILYDNICNNPKYRFEYRNSKLLDDIFMGRFDTTLLLDDTMKEQLGYIEPYYGLDSDMLGNKMKCYVSRYGIDYDGNNKDILTNQTTEVKRLFRCINRK